MDVGGNLQMRDFRETLKKDFTLLSGIKGNTINKINIEKVNM